MGGVARPVEMRAPDGARDGADMAADFSLDHWRQVYFVGVGYTQEDGIQG